MARDERVVDHGHGGHARARYSLGPVSEARRNVELKAVDPDPGRTLERAQELGAEDRGVIAQRDTYFRVREGRLKLREEEPGEAHLIAYARPDAADVRVSSYRVVPVPDPAGMIAALAETNGIDVVVAKRRRLLLWENVRIHLDEVEGLGSFVELEAVAEPDSDLARERRQVAQLREALRIADGALRELLGGAHGVIGVVTKRRRLFLHRNVRIHLDDVEGLGSFVELESVLASAGRESAAEAEALAEVVAALGLGGRETIAGGYLDLERSQG